MMASEFVPGLEGNTNKKGEIACDIGNLKTISFIPNKDSNSVKKEEILNFRDEGFLLHNVLSKEECQSLISEGENIGFEKLKGATESYRGQQRITLDAPKLAEHLWQRIKDFISDISFSENEDPKIQHIHGILFLLKGTWKPVGLNHVFRLCRYFPGGHFAPHYDGFYMKNSNERSMKTLMVYLNCDFEQGSTNFVKETQTLYRDESGKYRAQEENILTKIIPQTGMAIAFNHHRLHEGQEVNQGSKFILRTYIMYEKLDGDRLTDGQERALEFLQEAERLEGMGECMKASEYYRKAFKLAPELENCY